MTFARAKATAVRFATSIVAVMCAAWPTATGISAAPERQQGATFTSKVNMLPVDVMVVDRNGEPVLGLQPSDFSVSINRKERRIVSADLVHYENMARPLINLAGPTSLYTPGYVSDDSRVFVLAVDDSSFTPGGIKAALQSAQRFVANLRPSDMVGLYVYPFDRARLDVTHDHRAVQDALSRLIGRRDNHRTDFSLSPAEIIDLTAGDTALLQRIVAVECKPVGGQAADPACPDEIVGEAIRLSMFYESEAAQRIYGLGTLMQDLGAIPGRKTVVVISGGMLSANRIGGRPEVRGFMARLGEQAARSNVKTYVVHVDDTANELFSSVRQSPRRPTDYAMSMMASEYAYASGLERLATEAGGVYLTSKAGTGDLAFGRVLRETMAYYLLGVEPSAEDWDGRKLVVNVKTRAKGATVRALREVIAK